MFDSECFCFIYLLCLSAKIEHLLDFGITFEQGFAPLLFFRFLFGVLVVFPVFLFLLLEFIFYSPILFVELLVRITLIFVY